MKSKTAHQLDTLSLFVFTTLFGWMIFRNTTFEAPSHSILRYANDISAAIIMTLWLAASMVMLQRKWWIRGGFALGSFLYSVFALSSHFDWTPGQAEWVRFELFLFIGIGMAWVVLTAVVTKHFRRGQYTVGSVFMVIVIVLCAYHTSSTRKQEKRFPQFARPYSAAETEYIINTKGQGSVAFSLNGKSVGTTPCRISGVDMERLLAIPQNRGGDAIRIPAPAVPLSTKRSDTPMAQITPHIESEANSQNVRYYADHSIDSLDAKTRRVIVDIRAVPVAEKGSSSRMYAYFRDMLRYARANDYQVSDEWVDRMTEAPIEMRNPLLDRFCYPSDVHGNRKDETELLGRVLLSKLSIKEGDDLETFFSRTFIQGEWSRRDSFLEQIYQRNCLLELSKSCDNPDDLPSLLRRTISLAREPREHTNLRLLSCLLPAIARQLHSAGSVTSETQRVLDELASEICKHDVDRLHLVSAVLPSSILEEYYWRRYLASGKWTWSSDKRMEGGITTTELGAQNNAGPNFYFNKWLVCLIKMQGERAMELLERHQHEFISATRYLLEHPHKDSWTQYTRLETAAAVIHFICHHGCDKATVAEQLLPVFIQELIEQNPKQSVRDIVRQLWQLFEPEINVEQFRPYFVQLILHKHGYSDWPELEYYTSDREQRIKFISFLKEIAEELPDAPQKEFVMGKVTPILAKCGVPSAVTKHYTPKKPGSHEAYAQDAARHIYMEHPWKSGAPRFFPELLDEFRASPDPFQQLILLNCIEQVPTPTNRAMLVDFLTSEFSEVKAKAEEVKTALDHLKNNMPELPFKENNEKGTD
ncbi:hypothetical protein BVX99_01230 [bacterium F16]|nr:hypothetical protein BVX99_01230 [bacterium F16]